MTHANRHLPFVVSKKKLVDKFHKQHKFRITQWNCSFIWIPKILAPRSTCHKSKPVVCYCCTMCCNVCCCKTALTYCLLGNEGKRVLYNIFMSNPTYSSRTWDHQIKNITVQYL